MPAITISTTPILIALANAVRLDLTIMNMSATPCYLGDATVVAGQSIYLNQNDTFIDDYSNMKGYRGSIWGVTSSGIATLVFWERSQ